MVSLSARGEDCHPEFDEKTLRQRSSKLKLCQLVVCDCVVQDVSIHYRCVEQVEEDSLLPLHGTVSEAIVEDHLIG